MIIGKEGELSLFTNDTVYVIKNSQKKTSLSDQLVKTGSSTWRNMKENIFSEGLGTELS